VSSSLVIPARFNGPPDSGNGGFTCGCVAARLEGDAEVSLRSPPPLERPLSVHSVDGGVDVRDGDGLVAEARTTVISLDVPEAVPAEAAAKASAAGFERWSTGHPFPTCFVCGPAREPGDGLRIFPAAVGDMFVAGWTPDASLARPDGLVRDAVVWASLDCPTSAPLANYGKGPPIVLARLAARVEGPVRAGEPHALVSWEIDRDGRKRHAGAALFGAGGELLGRARALWIELK
jgi:hypothetical protein